MAPLAPVTRTRTPLRLRARHHRRPLASRAVDRPYDVAVVGAGIVGLATARELLVRKPARRLVVIDAASAVGTAQTGRNSGVIHAGVYYEPGSLKARLCV